MNRTAKPDAAVYNVGILIISALLFVPFLGQVHLFDWDEINFAESAREMITSGDYLTVQINYIPFWEKPPLFIWMQVLSMKLFGINEFAARFPNALCGVITLLILFNIGNKLAGKRFGLLWAALFGGSVLPFIYFKSGIIDPWFNLFIFLGIYHFFCFLTSENKRSLNITGSAVFIGLAILTKGPVALLIFFITAGVHLVIHKFRINIRFVDIVAFFSVLILVGGFWFILQVFGGNFGIIRDFIEYQVRLFSTHGAGHRGFLLYHFVVLLIGVFPASLLALPVLFGTRERDGSNGKFLSWMLILFWTVLILFTIVRTKIVHYSSLCYFPLTFVAAWWISHTSDVSSRPKRIVRTLIITAGVLLTVVIASLTGIDYFKDAAIGNGYIRDPFAVACLAADAGWRGYEWLTALVLTTGLILFSLYWNRDRFKSVFMLCGLVSAFVFLSMFMVAPRIETYSQRPAVEFFKSVSGEDAYLLTLGYKSYAHLFYGRATIQKNIKSRDEKWLLTGEVDKPVYIAAKSHKIEEYRLQYPDLVLLYKKNGYVFFKRIPNSLP